VIPALLEFLQGNPNFLFPDDSGPGYAALSAIDVFFGDGENGEGGVFTGGGIDALANYDLLSALPVYAEIYNAPDADAAIDALAGLDSLSAIPVYRDIAQATTPQEAAIAMGGLDSLSAVDTFFGDGPEGADGETPVGAVFGDGGVDALAPNKDSGGGGYAALSGLPVFYGSNNPNTNFGPGVFNPQAGGTGGLAALENYAALSAVPRYLNLPPNDAPPLPPAPRLPAPQERGAAPEVQTQQLGAVAPPADPGSSQPAQQPDPKSNKQGEVRNSLNFTPGGGVIPLFGSGKGKGADNGIRGWGDMLKKVGLNGGEPAKPKPAGGEGAEGGAPGGGTP
jgi:hypothetical protein